MNKKVILALALVLGLGLSDMALACSCAPPPPPAQARDAADSVFSGTVLSVTPGKNGLDVEIQVDRSWKQAGCGTVVVQTPSDSAMCGYGFEVGKSYLIYADMQKGKLSTNLCSRTRTIEEAGEDLAALGEPEKSCG
jgi:hypothetical protein